jgi:glutathionylspermidine synthase
VFENGERTVSVEGDYGAEGHILQAYHPLPNFGGNYPMVGSWLVASQPAGIGIREDTSLVTGNNARFLPHIISE